MGTYQIALVARSMRVPLYALTESYKFLRHYPLSQTDLPLTTERTDPPYSFPSLAAPRLTRSVPPASAMMQQTKSSDSRPSGDGELAGQLGQANPSVDVTSPDLIELIITDLGSPLSPTSVSQYIVAQFSS